MSQQGLSVTDNRTGKRYEIPIENGAIRATELRRIKVGPEDFGPLAYDPAFMNTASCKSTITFIDGERGVLCYRGYPIEELAEQATYLETTYLLLHGELPSAAELDAWRWEITHHTWIHENLKKFLDGFHHDAHPMAMLVSAVAALSAFYPDAKNAGDAETRRLQVIRLIAKMPTLAAFAYRHSLGMPYAYPDNDLSYAGNFLNMLFKTTELTYRPNPVLERAIEVLFILHADHEQNCSTNAVRSVGSSRVDPYCAVAAGVAALYGPLHGGANEAVLRMLREIGSVERVPEFIRKVKAGEARLMGFGHMALVQRGEPVQHFDMATRTKAGRPVWLDISILVVPGVRSDLATTVHFFRDVTASREIETLVRERLARASAPAGPDTGSADALTRRELEVLRLVAGGANTRAVAERLHVSPATVRNHVQNIFGKLGVHSRLEAAAYATRHGLFPSEAVPGIPRRT